MSLARHVNPEDIVSRLEASSLAELRDGDDDDPRSQAAVAHLTPYTSRYSSQVNLPKFKIPREGAEADTVYSMLKDELDLDGKPNLNLASFVGTYLEPNAQQLMAENLAKNLADADEYPAMMAIHGRCVSILAHLWDVRPDEKAIGSATTGSSEAIHLGGLAMKRRWQERRRAEGKDASRPNILMGANAQVALEKFARYFDVEARILPVSAASRFRLDPALVRENVDENTIGVFVILGSTYTGHYEPVQEVSEILDRYQEETGIDIPIHVDAASGGFIAPFTHAQVGGPKWNFELPRVKSINVSGHKFGLVTAGVGWIVWRDESFLPRHLIFELHYLGGTEESFTLNFSRPGAHVIVQYYNLIHIGFNGYRGVMENCLANARLLSKSLEATGWYTCVSDIHRRVDSASSSSLEKKEEEGKDKKKLGGVEGVAQSLKSAVVATTKQPTEDASAAAEKDEDKKKQQKQRSTATETSAGYVAGLPVVAFRFSDEFRREFPRVQQETVSLLLRARQWIIPNYALPPSEEKTEILRVVVRESMSLDLMERLVADVCDVTQTLMRDDEVDLEALHRHAGLARPRRDGQHHHHRRRDDREGEKQGQGQGQGQGHKGQQHRHRMSEGVHKSVC